MWQRAIAREERRRGLRSEGDVLRPHLRLPREPRASLLVVSVSCFWLLAAEGAAALPAALPATLAVALVGQPT